MRLKNQSRKVIVLYGGISAEREVSLSTGKNVGAALLRLGYDAKLCDVTEDGKKVVETLLRETPFAVFNALHGGDGEDGTWQTVLNLLRIPYTHSGAEASRLGMDKVRAKEIFKKEGIPVAKQKVVSRESLKKGEPMKRPFVVKPTNEGSSVGVQILLTAKDRLLPVKYQEVLVEEYIPGREIQVAVLRNKALGLIEIIPKKSFFYDYASKYEPDGSEHILPKDLPREISKKLCDYAVRAHKALGCRGLSRVDFRYDPKRKRVVILEVNTQPGMTKTSLVPDIAKQKGISYEKIVSEILKDAAVD